MIILPVKRELFDYSKNLIKENNYGRRGKHDGSKKDQLIGILAENMVRQYLGHRLVQPNNEFFDGGWDIIYKGLRADVKSMNRKVDTKPYYVNNVYDVQLNHNSEAYIFTSLNTKKSNLSICGWVTKKQFVERAKFYKKGTMRERGNGPFPLEADNWEIENKDLNEFS